MSFLINFFIQPQKNIFKKILQWTCYFIIVVASAIYVGNVLFGNRSYEVLRDLQKEKATLFNDIETLKTQNSKLQKQYLEKLALEPDVKK